ncbi:MAG: glutamate racemase [candidate division WOR-3 bacterium]
MRRRLPRSESSRPIGVFDSGIGGLTIVKEIRKILPKEDILYFGDTARLPYGSKSPELIRRYALEDAHFLYERKVKIIVVACHSASSWALSEIRNSFPVPVVGVLEPGAKAALSVSRRKKIGVIGTKATISSGAYERALKERDKDVEIIAKATPLLVPLVEEDFISHPVSKIVCREYLKVFLTEKVDALLLGCTHYPLLRSVIREVLKGKVKVIDAGKETAKEVKRIIEERGIKKSSGRGKLKIYLSDITPEFEKIAQIFLGEKPEVILRASLREITKNPDEGLVKRH